MKDWGHPGENGTRETEMAFKCGKCGDKHLHAADGRACYAGKSVPVVAPCTWLVPRKYLDFDYVEQTLEVECGAEAVYDDEGFRCAAGHSHINAEIMAQRGQVYVDSPEEAYVLGYYNPQLTPISMDGSHEVTPERPVHWTPGL